MLAPDVRLIDGNASLLLLRRPVNLVVGSEPEELTRQMTPLAKGGHSEWKTGDAHWM